MALTASVLPVMIASPGDVHGYRSIARDVLHEWNYIHTVDRHLVLMPVGWDTHSSPELGSSPQELINDRILEDCDALIGIFWTRLGTPTASAPSGTVEEIRRHISAGKPALIYFSTQPVAPDSLDPEQYKELRSFRAWCETQGLVETFSEENQFKAMLARHVQIALQNNPYLRAIMRNAAQPATTQVLGVPVAATSGSASSQGNVTLSPEALELLRAAAGDESGMISAIDALDGRLIQVGSRRFGDRNNRRIMARWDYGIEQLGALSLVDLLTTNRHMRMYRLNERGYRMAEQLGGTQG